MIGWTWLAWIVFMFVFVISPLGYGWGYRGWGPPYPRYIQRRREAQAVAANAPAFNHRSWGLSGDILCIILIVAAFWPISAMWGH